MRLQIFATFASLIALVAGQASQRCFITNNWVITAGKPNVLIWDAGSFWDVILNSGVHTQAETAGIIARNISENSVVWIPPKDIMKGQPNQVFAVQLWDLAKGTGCVSPSFRFVDDDSDDSDDSEEAASLPAGPFVTTAVSLINFGSITATATVATFQSDQAAEDHTITGSITGTDTAIVTATSLTGDDDKGEGPSSGPDVIAIAIGTAFGVLILVLVILSILLFRSRRKRARQRANSDAELKLVPPGSSATSAAPSPFEMDAHQVAAKEVQGESARYEMAAVDRPQELPETGPVELPAEEIQPPKYPGDDVSSLGDSRRSSMEYSAFLVSPAVEEKR
ncbi:hypothetical protein CC79DRAFT_1321317 [Sarocladium strictum]